MRRLRFFALLLAIFAAGIGSAVGEELQIVCLGTSFTNGKGVSRNQAWPAKLEADLRAQGLSVRVINQGVNGDTTINLKSRFSKAVSDGTSIVILEYAIGNEKRAGVPIEQTVENVDEIVSQLLSRKIQVLLVMRARNVEGLQRRAKRFRRTISKFGIPTIGIEQPDSSLLADRAHATIKVHEQIAASMANPVKELIANVGK
jgi:acyl-CoA thioesterase-1